MRLLIVLFVLKKMVARKKVIFNRKKVIFSETKPHGYWLPAIQSIEVLKY